MISRSALGCLLVLTLATVAWGQPLQQDVGDFVRAPFACAEKSYCELPRAGQALRSLYQEPFRAGLHATVAQWLEVHQLVADRGVAGMSEHYEAQRAATTQRIAEEAQRRRAEQEDQRRLREAQKLPN
jgi:hypothetical protein